MILPTILKFLRCVFIAAVTFLPSLYRVTIRIFLLRRCLAVVRRWWWYTYKHTAWWNCLKNNQRENGKNWSRVPDGCLTPRRTGRLIVRSHKLTFISFFKIRKVGWKRRSCIDEEGIGITMKFNSWFKIMFQKPIAVYSIGHFPFSQLEGSLPCLEHPVTRPCPKQPN
jgi:hypothetical protein